MPLHVSSTCAHYQEVKIALHSLWYHHTYRCKTKILYIKLVNYSDKYTEMHGQQNVKIYSCIELYTAGYIPLNFNLSFVFTTYA